MTLSARLPLPALSRPTRPLSAAVVMTMLLVLAPLTVLFGGAAPADALANGLARTPPMGWNDWNAFGCNVTEQLVEQTADYLVADGFTTLNQVSSVGAFLLGASTLPFLWNVYISRNAPLVEIDDPWVWGRSLEWATSSPPPRHNFVTLPRIRSESPAFDLHHPEVAAMEAAHNESGERVAHADGAGKGND